MKLGYPGGSTMRKTNNDRPMFAPDMFVPNLEQVFSVRTGEFIGYHRTGGAIPREPEPEPEPEPEQANKDQYSLF